MATDVTLPALGESVTEGTISRWLKAVGDTIEADEPIVEVSTDKVDTEIPSPAAGVLLEIRVEEDETAEVGQVLCVVGEEGEGSDEQGEPEAQEESGMEPDQVAEPKEAASDPTPTDADDAHDAAPAPAGTSTEVPLPALGESVTEGTISRWLKAVGDEVEVDEPIVEVSTDKVDTEIPSPTAGVVLEICVGEDETAAVGQVLAIIGEPGAAGSSDPETAEEPEPEAPAEAPAAPRRSDDEAATSADEAKVARRSAGQSDAADDIYVTPLVRAMAEERGVDLTSLVGTGVGGRIRKADVLAAAKGEEPPIAAPQASPAATPATQAPAQAEAPAPRQEASAAPAPSPSSAPADPKIGTTEKMSRLRKVIAERMVESLQTSAQLTATVEVDMTAISRLRGEVKESFKKREGVGLSYLPFITKAAVESLKEFPVVNATVDAEEGTITYADGAHVGIAVDTEKGLLVPVIKQAHDFNIAGLARKIADLANRARTNALSPDDLAGGTFTITNYGSAGTLFDTPIINQPQVAILGTGALVKRPVVMQDNNLGETIAVRDMMYLSMTYDHRVIDGAVAARFLAAVKERLEEGDFDSEFGL